MSSKEGFSESCAVPADGVLRLCQALYWLSNVQQMQIQEDVQMQPVPRCWVSVAAVRLHTGKGARPHREAIGWASLPAQLQAAAAAPHHRSASAPGVTTPYQG